MILDLGAKWMKIAHAFTAVIVMVVVLVGPTAPIAATEETTTTTPAVTVEGVVHINNEPGWRGITIVLVAQQQADNEEVECGEAPVGESGGYTLTLLETCLELEARAFLRGVDERKSSESTLLPDKPSAETVTFNPRFSLVNAELSKLPERPLPPDVDPAGQALVERSKSVFEEVEGLLIALLISGAILLAIMAGALILLMNRRYKFLVETFKTVDIGSDERLKDWIKFLKAERESRYRVFRWMVEGLVLSFVVIAVIALGAAGKIEGQGVVSILAAMVGYAAGRTSS